MQSQKFWNKSMMPRILGIILITAFLGIDLSWAREVHILAPESELNKKAIRLFWRPRFGPSKPKDSVPPSPPPAKPLPIESPATEAIRQSQEAFAYTDPLQDFSGIDLEHFVHAQFRLAERLLSQGHLRQVLNYLGIREPATEYEAYTQIYEKLAEGRYDKQVIDLINAGTYEDPRLAITIIGQNPNPRAQGVYEAISNSLDALGFHIGQFGKGVKQIIDWPLSTGEDRIDVWTKEERGSPYRLTLLRDRRGQNYIQIKKISIEEFQGAAGKTYSHGTVLRVTTKDAIPRTDEERDERRRNSQEGLVQGVHRRFPYVSAVKITTQMAGQAHPQQVNGFGEKAVIIPAGLSPAPLESAEGKAVQVVLTEHTITIIDNGTGMGSGVLSRMFVPKEGTKHPQPLSGEAAESELAKVKVVQDLSLSHRVSFARNGEAVVAIDIPAEIHKDATVSGGLMVEFGGLLDVPESRDQIIIPLDLKAGEVSNFQLAIDYCFHQLLNHPTLSAIEKVKYINTIIIGIDGLIKGNENYAFVVKSIRAKAQKDLTDLIGRLEQEGFIILPHNKQFEKLAIPKDKRAFFIHEGLFNWQGAVSLRKIGGEVVPGLSLAGEKRLPLVVIPFTPKSLKGVSQYNKLWHTWHEDERLPIIKTGRFIAIPNQLGSRLLSFAKRRAKGALDSGEEKEFLSLVQRVNILTAEEVATSYEVTAPRENVSLAPQFEMSAGEIDSDAINKFLTKPPVMTQGPSQPAANQVPADANQRLVLLENGDLIEVGTGRKIRENVYTVELLENGFYKIITTELWDERGHLSVAELLKIMADGNISIDSGDTIIISPNRKFAYMQNRDMGDMGIDKVVDLENDKRYFLREAGFVLRNWGEVLPEQSQQYIYSDVQFSRDGKYLTYLEKSPHGAISFMTVDLQEKRALTRVNYGLVSEIEYALNPFANVAFVKVKGVQTHMDLIDLTDGAAKCIGKQLHTDSTGIYTAIVGFAGEMTIYLHKAKRMLMAGDFGAQGIRSVRTHWKDGRAFFEATVRTDVMDVRYCFDTAGHISEGRNGDYYEWFDTDGQYGVYFFEKIPQKDFPSGELDPLQRLDRQGGYKHPHFDLFIDNSDPENPVAIEPKTGRRFSYKGEIVEYEREVMIIWYYDGESLLVTDGEQKRNPFGRLVSTSYRGPSLEARIFVSVWETPAGRKYALLDFGREERLFFTPISLEYSSLSFDGKYFVFTNPQTGDVAYLNPEDPDHPIFVPAEPATTFLDTKPADAPNRFVIGQIVIGQIGEVPCSLDTETGDPALRYPSFKRISRDTFLVFDAEDRPIIFKGNEVLFEPQPQFTESLSYSVVSHTDRFVVFERPGGPEGGKSQFLLDINTGKTYPDFEKDLDVVTLIPLSFESHRKVDISASGRFSIHQKHNGELVYYDHSEPEPIENIIAEPGTYQEYSVHKDADVVIIKDIDSNRGYHFKDLSQGHLVAVEEEHIEIDSSGTIVVAKTGAGLFFKNLKSEDLVFEPYIAKVIRVASNEEGVYVLFETEGLRGDNALLIIYDHEGRLISSGVYALTHSLMLPRFWESYDLEKKTIWDRETGDKSSAFQTEGWNGEIEYRLNTPTSTYRETIELVKTVAIGNIAVRARLPDQMGGGTIIGGKSTLPESVLVNLETGEWKYFKLEARGQRWRSLKKGKVWYLEREDGNVRFCHYYHPTMETWWSSDTFKVFVNQDKTFILGEDKTMRETYHLLDSNGQATDITDRVPAGFVPTDVNGRYFVFVNPQTQQVKYLDPIAVSVSEPVSPEEHERQEETLSLWNNQIVPKRAQWIAQARGAYQPFLELIPEEFRAEIEQGLRPVIEKLYEEQESHIRKRFDDSINGNPLDLVTPLPFERFTERMGVLYDGLSEFLSYSDEVIAQEESLIQRGCYRRLFINLFRAASDSDFDLTPWSGGFFNVLNVIALGWEIEHQGSIDDAWVLFNFYHALTGLRTGPPLGFSEGIKIFSFLSHVSSKGLEKHQILITQLKKLLQIPPESTPTFSAAMTRLVGLLTKLREGFQRVEGDILMASLEDTGVYNRLGDVRPFVVFLTNEVEQVREKARSVPEGTVVLLPGGGIEISQIVELEQKRQKRGPEDVVMGIEYLCEHLGELPGRSEALEADILRNTTVQGESGAWAREITQNSNDAKATELVVDFYMQKGELGQAEFIEEARDNGTGALEEVALLIPKSTKAAAGQMDLTGFFGTGKYTIFEGVDRLEIITKNQKRAYMFTFTVIKDTSGKATAVKLTGIRELTDVKISQGVTIRRIKTQENTIPELDQMLAQRAWKTFAGLAQGERFKIYFIDHEGERQKLNVEMEVLSQTEFKALKPRETQETSFGIMRLLSTKDMPLQILDRTGLRVCELKESYLALIPAPLRRHIGELGINIQVPLPLIRGRSAFEHEQEYLHIIQKYVAIEFYKAIAYKTLTQTSPQFVFEGFPLDWKTNDHYWYSIDLDDAEIINLAERINKGRYGEVTEGALNGLLTRQGQLDIEKKFVKLLLLLEVSTDQLKPEERTSLLLRRLAIQQEVNMSRAQAQVRNLSSIGLSVGRIPNVAEIPNANAEITQARVIEAAHEQMRNPERYLVDPSEYTPMEQELVAFAFLAAGLVGIEQVLLVSNEVQFAGAFITYKGKRTMLLARSLAQRIGRPKHGFPIIDDATDVIIHELAHLLEEEMRLQVWQEGFVAHAANFTHDAVGTFAEAMKYNAGLWLANHESSRLEPASGHNAPNIFPSSFSFDASL